MTFEEYQRKRQDLQWLIEEIDRTYHKVIDAKENGSSRIRVSAIADPISDILRPLIPRLAEESRKAAAALMEFVGQHSQEWNQRYNDEEAEYQRRLREEQA